MQTPASTEKPKSSVPPPPATLIGRVLSGRYRIERILGEGGMGAVYLAEHTLMKKRLAVKVLHAELLRVPEVLARFEREAMAAAHIEHPNVASATDFVKGEDGTIFLVLEYVEGQSLREAIAHGPMPARRAVHIANQICAALVRAHSLGIVHRDLKPENVMLVERDGDPDFVKVLDFGIAKVPMGEANTEGASITQAGMVYGTPKYMPPEQALGQPVDPRADLYCVGVILYEMLSGKRPFDDESKVKLLGKHLTAPVPPLREQVPVSNDLEAIVVKLLEKDAKDRFQEAKEVSTALGLAALDPTPPPAPATAVTSAGHPLVDAVVREAKAMTPRFLAIAGGSLAGLLLLVVMIVVAAKATSPDAPKPRPTASASASSAPGIEDDLRRADALVQSGDHDRALSVLQAIEKREPKRPEVEHRLFALYNEKSDDREAMRTGSAWLDGDPAAKGDDVLVAAAKRAASGKDAPEAGIAVLEKTGPKGIEALYDLAYATSNSAASQRAQKSLAKPEVHDAASPAVQVLIELRRATTCEQKHTAVQHAETSGDDRALPLLNPLASTRGCGFAGFRDCYPCLRDGSLGRATAAIKARTR